jgi:uncharacterized protein (UPF0332 family)
LRIAKARQTAADARAMLDRASTASAVNRAYYSAFYAARALLATEGLDSAKHSGVLALFDKHFVLPGLVSREHGRALHDLFAERNKADYADRAEPDLETAARLVRRAEAFVGAAAALLQQRLSRQ